MRLSNAHVSDGCHYLACGRTAICLSALPVAAVIKVGFAEAKARRHFARGFSWSLLCVVPMFTACALHAGPFKSFSEFEVALLCHSAQCQARASAEQVELGSDCQIDSSSAQRATEVSAWLSTRMQAHS